MPKRVREPTRLDVSWALKQLRGGVCTLQRLEALQSLEQSPITTEDGWSLDRQVIAASDDIAKALVEVLRSADAACEWDRADVKMLSAYVMRDLTRSDETVHAVACAPGAIEELVRLLSSPVCRDYTPAERPRRHMLLAKEAAAIALMHLAEDSELAPGSEYVSYADDVVEANAVPWLVRLLDCSNAGVSRAAAAALTELVDSLLHDGGRANEVVVINILNEVGEPPDGARFPCLCDVLRTAVKQCSAWAEARAARYGLENSVQQRLNKVQEVLFEVQHDFKREGPYLRLMEALV